MLAFFFWRKFSVGAIIPPAVPTHSAFASTMTLEKRSHCKVNLLLNILGKRPDSFHELETVMHPVRVHDQLSFTRAGSGVQLTCNEPSLPTDSRNLVYRAAM